MAESHAFEVIANNGTHVAKLLPFDPEWMEGSIRGADFTNADKARTILATAVLDSLTNVDPDQLAYTTCTDGRERVGLPDGEPAPIRESLVGASAISGFRIAEGLGHKLSALYGSMPLAKRFRYAADLMKANGEEASTHQACGAAAGFIAVNANEYRFSEWPTYRLRMGAVMPPGVYDYATHANNSFAASLRAQTGMYSNYSDVVVTEHVKYSSGDTAIEHYVDDGRGVCGHTEAAIAIVSKNIVGLAIDPNKLIAATGQQVFHINNSRADRLAGIFSNGGQDEAAYVGAWHSLASFSATGHGTLGRGLETWLIEDAA